jgi:hypothetical protein
MPRMPKAAMLPDRGDWLVPELGDWALVDPRAPRRPATDAGETGGAAPAPRRERERDAA